MLRDRRSSDRQSRIAEVALAKAAVTMQKAGAYRDPRLYALNVFAEQFSHSVQPLVPDRLFINNGGGNGGEHQASGGNVLENLLSLILSEKAGINYKRKYFETIGGIHPRSSEFLVHQFPIGVDVAIDSRADADLAGKTG